MEQLMCSDLKALPWLACDETHKCLAEWRSHVGYQTTCNAKDTSRNVFNETLCRERM
jgi:hypothetical protein